MRKIILIFLGLLFFSISNAKVDTREIRGIVLAKSDQLAMIGAAVFVPQDELKRIGIEGKQFAGITDFDGKFRIDIPQLANKITIQYLGYKTVVLKINSKEFFNIYLEEDAQQIEEVVVTGYGKIAKHKYTGSVTQVRMDKIEQIGVASVENMLEGKLAGVQTINSSGAPGSKPRISIRGVTSFSGNSDPLWVVDGVPIETPEFKDFNENDLDVDNLENTSIAGLNPQDIAGITVLKDAAATAIYGARAANGVIVVTTRKGKAGKLSISTSAVTGVIFKPDYTKLNLMNSTQKIDLELDLLKNKEYIYYDHKGSVSRIINNSNELTTYRLLGFDALGQSTKNEIEKLRGVNTNWEDELFQLSINQDYSLSMTGGTDKATYYASVGYHTEKGTVIGTGLDRLNLTFKTSFQASEKIKLGLSTFVNNRQSSSYLTQAGSHTNPSRYSRTVNAYQMIYDDNGSYIYDPDISSNQINRTIPFNIVEEREGTSHELDALNVNAIADFEYKIYEGLLLTSQFGIQKEKSYTEKTASQDSYFMRDFFISSESSIIGFEEQVNEGQFGWWKNELTEEGDFYTLPRGGYKEEDNKTIFQYNWKNMLNYNWTFNKSNDFDFMLGTELRKAEIENTITRRVGYNFQTLQSKNYVPARNIKLSARYRPSDAYSDVNAYLSYFGTASYTYNKKYTLFGSVRYDGANMFGADEKDKFTPIWALSGTWRASEESFMQQQDIINNLNLRFSYGLQGNVVNSSSPLFIGQYVDANILNYNYQTIQVSSLPNPNLSWEKTENYNFGFDFSILRHRISISADIYYRYTTDLVSLIQIPAENGTTFASSNWGEMSNKGFELSISTLNYKSDEFEWNTSFNISKNINKVEKQNVRADATTPSMQGYSFNSVFGFRTAGYNDNGHMQFYDTDGNIVLGTDLFSPGGSDISSEEMQKLYVHLGDYDPDFNGGITNRFKYKDLSLSVSASFIINQGYVEEPPYNISEFDRGLNYSSVIMDRWTPDNQNAKYPKIYAQNSSDPVDKAHYHLYDGTIGNTNLLKAWDVWYKEISYVRINSIKLSYNLNPEYTNLFGVKSLGISLEGRNLFVISNDYTGYFDPETYGNRNAQPIPRSLNLGMNVRF